MEVSETSEQNMCSDIRILGLTTGQCYRKRSRFLLKRLQGNDISDDSEISREDKRRRDQARLARQLKNVDKRRLLGVESSEANSSEKMSWQAIKWKEKKPAPLELQMEEEHRVIRLIDVTILPKLLGGQGGDTIVGTLETHVNGFKYSDSSFQMQFYFVDIKTSFFRLGDKRMPPLLHFHLHQPIMMGTEKTRDIEFRLVQNHDSDKIQKEKQISDGGHNEDLKNFVDKVDARWTSPGQPISHFPFEELQKEYEFYGVLPSKASAAFALTSFYLIVFVETPFVVPLMEIEIVNLDLLRPGEIDMAVIFQDFKEENVLEINSIPLKSLAGIKHRLNSGHVKYYVNAEKHDWRAIVKGIADFPKKFIEKGGWDFYELEDRDTLAYYKETTDEPEKFIEYFRFEGSDTKYYTKLPFSPEIVQMKINRGETKEIMVVKQEKS